MTHLTNLATFLTGSRAYGYATPNSDHDYRMIHTAPLHEIVSGLYQHTPKEGANAPGLPQGTNTEDAVSFELGHFANLLLKGTPNAVELLWLPQHCHIHMHPLLLPLMNMKRSFLHQGFENALLGYCKGEIHNAQKDLLDLEQLQKNPALETELSHKTKRLPKRISHVFRLTNMLKELKNQTQNNQELQLNVQRPDAKLLLQIRTSPQTIWHSTNPLDTLQTAIKQAKQLIEHTSQQTPLPKNNEQLRHELALTITNIRLQLHQNMN